MPPDDAGPEFKKPDEADEAPPFLGRWRNVYTAIALYLVTLIVLFTLFTRSFNR